MQRAAAALAQLHDRADVVARGDDRGPHHGLVDRLDLAAGVALRVLARGGVAVDAAGEVAGVGHPDLAAAFHDDAVDDVRGGGDERQVPLALQPLPDDLHVQQAEEPAAEPEAERGARLRLVDQRGVVEPELVERVPQLRVLVAVDRVQAGEHHRLGVVVAREGCCGRLADAGDRVADPRLADVLHAGDEVADLAGAEAVGGERLRGDDPYFEGLVHGLGGHHEHALALAEVPVHDPQVGDNAAVGVVDRVEDQRSRRGVGVAVRRRDLLDDRVEQVLDALARLGGHPHDLGRVDADDRGDLARVPLGLRRGQVDLVQHRDDLQVSVERQVEVGERLRLDALRRVHQQDGALAGSEAPRYLVAEVDVARACR